MFDSCRESPPPLMKNGSGQFMLSSAIRGGAAMRVLRFRIDPMTRHHGLFVLAPAIALLVFLGIGFCAWNAALAGDWRDASPHQVHFVTVAPGVQLEVLDWGGDGDGLIFLAGLSMNAHSFDDFAPRFTDTHRVYGITRRGHGASTWPESGYSLGRLVEDIRVVLDHLGIQRAVLAGNSMAGDEMTRLAGEDPQRVAGLVYIDAAHDGTLIDRLGIFDVCPTWQEIMAANERRFENPEAVRRTQLRVRTDGTTVPNMSDIALAQLAASESAPDYSRVRAPALAVYHVPSRVEDVFGSESAVSDECISAMQRFIYESIAGFASGMRRARIVAFHDTRHIIHLVSPDALEDVMRRWLAALPGT